MRPIIDWLKKHAAEKINALKSALKRGYDAFKGWFNALPKWMRSTILFLWSGTLWELIDSLLKYFF